MDVCQGSGTGGAQCAHPDGKNFYLSPSQLENSWIIPTQKEAGKFVAWCYDVSEEDAQKGLEIQKKEILK